jgi:oligopeptide/dipeptide ABC transporter ATP-binding protein
LVEIQEEFHLTYLLIAHDLAVVEYLSDQVAIMYLGRIVELAGDRDIYLNPRHPYTQYLLDSVPGSRTGQKRKRLTGEVPSPLNPPPGCHFHPRCPERGDLCAQTPPELRLIGPDHWLACHLYDGRPARDESDR